MNAHGTSNGKPVGSEPFFHGWFIVGILFFISILDGGFSYIFAAFLKPLVQEFGWTRAETSGVFSLYLLAAGLVLPLWGWGSFRICMPWVCACLLCSCRFLVWAWADSWSCGLWRSGRILDCALLASLLGFYMQNTPRSGFVCHCWLVQQCCIAQYWRSHE
jgi:hypothetical protein